MLNSSCIIYTLYQTKMYNFPKLTFWSEINAQKKLMLTLSIRLKIRSTLFSGVFSSSGKFTFDPTIE